ADKQLGATSSSRCRRVLAAIESGERLARQCQHHRRMAQLHNVSISLNHFIGIAGSQGNEPGYRTQRNKVLDGLMSWTIFTIAHGVVRKDKNRRQLNKGGELVP